MHKKLWVHNEVSEEKIKHITEKTGISTLLAKVLLGRGISDIDYIKKLLSPSLDDLHDPFLLKDMEKAVIRILEAIGKNENIVIFGDYDVDGITSTSILYDFLSRLSKNVNYYIPGRIDEGYGLSKSAIDKIRDMGTGLIITADCGITSIDEVRYIKEHNMDVIITDHHECKECLPEAYAVVNPCRPDCAYPFKELAGVGVAYKLINALCLELGLGNMHLNYLGLVALGTVADVVPLEGENRIIVKYGISKVENTSNLGIRMLINNSGLKGKPITSWGISFVIAPRINAAGRIGDAGRAVKLFTTNDETEALDIALELNQENKYRQDAELEIFQDVVNTIEASIDLEKEKVIIVAGDGWHHGIIGIVASKITERYYRPCILISNEDGVGKGSGRSIEGFNLFKALCHCEDLLDKYGGHELAAGLSINIENVPELRKRINDYADCVLDEHSLIPKVKIDIKINKNDISLNSIKELDKLAPFGAGNPSPVFAYDRFSISDIRTVGEDKHLKLKLKDDDFYIDAIGFNMGALAKEYTNSDILDVACTLEINAWNSTEKVQLNLKDVKPNNEVVMENEYYYSLDKCIDFRNIVNDNNTCGFLHNVGIRKLDQELMEWIDDNLKGQDKIAIVVNTLEDTKRLESTLRNSALEIKTTYKICYSDFDADGIHAIYAIVNPNADEIDFTDFKQVIFYGMWINKAYLSKLLCKVESDKIYFYNNTGKVILNVDAIVPARKDLVAVYQYMKANSKNYLDIDDLFVFANKIADSYKISMNYFKLKKSIEIFEELKLINKERKGKYGMTVTIMNNGQEKTNLENSILYRKLQAMQSQLKEAY